MAAKSNLKPQTAGLPARSEVLCGRAGGGIDVDVGVSGDDHRVRAVAYICMSAQNAALPAHGEQPACGPWTLMRVRPPPSVQLSRAAAFPGTISGKLSTSCSATYLLLTAVRRPPPLEVEVAPVKKGPYQDRPLLYPFHHFLSLLWSCFSPDSA